MALPEFSAPGAVPRRLLPTLAAAVVVVAALIWLGSRADDVTQGYHFTGRNTEYYSLLVDGFLKGQLHMDVSVPADHPNGDPPYLLDANFYNGRYYLYYGVVPAVLVLLPYQFLTGHHLSSNGVVVLFLIVGFGFALGTFEDFRRRHFPTLPKLVHFLLVLFLGLGSAIPFLAVRGAFYELPIAAGYAFSMAALWCVRRILDDPDRSYRYLIASSLLLSLAVGCRPNYLLALPALLIPAYHVWQARRLVLAPRRATYQIAVALLLPSLSIGALLGWYNYARFGSPLEFGFKYGMNSFFTSGNPLASWRFVWPNLDWYYFSPPSLSPYFPFFYPVAGSFRPSGYHGDESMHGQVAVTLFALLLAVYIVLHRRSRQSLRPLVSWFAVLAWVWATSLVFMLFLTIRGNRYMVDFHASLVLGLVCASGVVLHQLRLRRRLGSLLFGLAASVGVITSFGSSLQQFDDLKNGRPGTFQRLSRIFNYPSYWAHQLGLFTYGPVAFEVVFDDVASARVEPLFVAGTPYYTDGLFVAQHPGNQIQYMLDHHGYGGPVSELMSVEAGRRYRIELLIGALYPPENHPYFDAIDPLFKRSAKQTAKLTVDGKTMIEGKMAAYDAPPWSHQYGKNLATLKPFGAFFSGQVTPLPRPPLAVPLFAKETLASGISFLWLKFPRHTPHTREPIVAVGKTGAGVLLLAEWLPDGSIRFGLDDWGHGLYYSEPLTVDPEALHELKIFFGPLAAKHPWPPSWGIEPAVLEQSKNQLHLWLNDERVWSVPVRHHHDHFEHLSIGVNEQGFSTANPHYAAELMATPHLESQAREFVKKNLSAVVAD